MKTSAILAVCGALGASFLLADRSQASYQKADKLEFPAASPGSTVKERVGLTDVTIEYSRPSMRERKVYGGLVAYGEVWRTGANRITTISFSSDVKFGGQDVPAGDYALLTIPAQDEWTFILNKDTQLWGSYSHDAKKDVVRAKAKPVALSVPVETLWIGLDRMRDDSADLTIAWEKTRVSVPIQTDLVKTMVPRIEAAMVGDGEKPYLQAAMFYYEHDLDLTRAVDWIDAAAVQQPDAPWILYRKGLIQEKAGDKAGALASAKAALEQAKKAGGELGSEYTRLSEALIARLK